MIRRVLLRTTRALWCSIVAFSLVASWLGEGELSTASDGQTQLSTPRHGPGTSAHRRIAADEPALGTVTIISIPACVRPVTVLAAQPCDVVVPRAGRASPAHPRAPPSA